jgi:hypothetical protein
MAENPEPNTLVLPGKDFAFEMGLGKSVYPWFDTRACHPGLLEQRKQIAAGFPARAIFYTPEAEPLLREVYGLIGRPDLPSGREGLEIAAGVWDIDFVVLSRSNGRQEPVMAAGVICFPSSWRPEDKIGHEMSAIHGPVPTLNDRLGARIARFLNLLKPNKTLERFGWGIAATDEEDLHPSRDLARLTPNTDPGQLYLRWEHQGFYALSGGVLFMIRILVTPFASLTGPQKGALRHQIQTMPDAIADYKGLLPAREHLLDVLAPA